MENHPPAGRRGSASLRRLPGPALLLAPAVLFMVITYVVPIAGLLLTSFGTTGWTTAHYAEVFDDPVSWSVLGDTFLLAARVTLICALLAYPLALMTLRASSRMQKIILILMILPLWTSVLVRAYAWMVLLGRRGIVNDAMLYLGMIGEPLQILYGKFAVLLGLVHLLLPFAYFPLLAVMRRIDGKLVAAASSLGAPRIASFALVFFPLSMPGLLSGSLIVFLHAIGYFVTPAILGGLREVTYVMLIEEQVNQLFNWEKAAVMSVILLAITLVIVTAFGRSLGMAQSRSDQPVKTPALMPWALRGMGLLLAWSRRAAGSSSRDGTASAIGGAAAGMALKLTGLATILFLLLPIFILLPLSFSASPFLEFPPPAYSLRWYDNYFSRADWLGPTLTSLQVALVTTVLVTALGLAAAIGITRARFRGAKLCLALLLSPAMIPTLIIAVALYFQLSRLGLVGTRPGLVLAHLVIALPIVLLVLTGALRRVDHRPEMAARSLGAGPIRAFLKTTFVMIRPSIVAAALFAFLASFDDVTVALFISGTLAVTLPIKMWESVRLEIDPTLAAVSSLLVLLSLLCLATAELARRLGRDGERQPSLPGT